MCCCVGAGLVIITVVIHEVILGLCVSVCRSEWCSPVGEFLCCGSFSLAENPEQDTGQCRPEMKTLNLGLSCREVASQVQQQQPWHFLSLCSCVIVYDRARWLLFSVETVQYSAKRFGVSMIREVVDELLPILYYSKIWWTKTKWFEKYLTDLSVMNMITYSAPSTYSALLVNYQKKIFVACLLVSYSSCLKFVCLWIYSLFPVYPVRRFTFPVMSLQM